MTSGTRVDPQLILPAMPRTATAEPLKTPVAEALPAGRGFDLTDIPTFGAPATRSNVRAVVSGGGRPLDPAVQVEMESRLGYDFQAVRVHTGADAAASADVLSAKAYSVGTDVVFGPGEYAPETAAGRKLLVHELSHVVQQRNGPGDAAGHAAAESEATVAASRAAGGQPVLIQAGGGGGLQRDPKDDDDPALRAYFEGQKRKENPSIGSQEWVRRFQTAPGGDASTRVANPAAPASSLPAVRGSADNRAHTPPKPHPADQFRAQATEDDRAEQRKQAGHASGYQTPVGKTPDSGLGLLLTALAEYGLIRLETSIRDVVPPHFFEFGSARKGFVAAVTGIPVEPPADPWERAEWERGEDIAAVVLFAEALADGIVPPGGGPRPSLAHAGGGAPSAAPRLPAQAVPLETRQTGAPPTAPESAPAATAPGVAPAPAPKPQTEEERRAETARNPSTKTAPPKSPGETPKEADARTGQPRSGSGTRDPEPAGPTEETKPAGPTDATSEPLVVDDRLVNADKAELDTRKLTEYALNPDHPVGGNKARVFSSATGFNQANAAELAEQLRAGVAQNKPIPGKVDAYGSRFTVDIPVTGPTGSATVRTGWIYSPNSKIPRMTTAFIK